jgi:hypothetical protein
MHVLILHPKCTTSKLSRRTYRENRITRLTVSDMLGAFKHQTVGFFPWQYKLPSCQNFNFAHEESSKICNSGSLGKNYVFLRTTAPSQPPNIKPPTLPRKTLRQFSVKTRNQLPQKKFNPENHRTISLFCQTICTVLEFTQIHPQVSAGQSWLSLIRNHLNILLQLCLQSCCTY